MWNPWGTAGRAWRHVDIIWWHELPDGVRGLVRDGTIWLCRTLTQAERRCTLTHELVHLERGISDHIYRDAEEHAVDAETARRLITLDQLTEALQWSRHPHELADALWVDQPTLQARMATLCPVEVAVLEHKLGDEWLWIP